MRRLRKGELVKEYYRIEKILQGSGTGTICLIRDERRGTRWVLKEMAGAQVRKSSPRAGAWGN